MGKNLKASGSDPPHTEKPPDGRLFPLHMSIVLFPKQTLEHLPHAIHLLGVVLPRDTFVGEMLAVVVDDVVIPLPYTAAGGGHGLGGGGMGSGLLGGEDGGLAGNAVLEIGQACGQHADVGFLHIGAAVGRDTELDDLVGADEHAVVEDASRLHADHRAAGGLTGQPFHGPTFFAM